MCYYFFRNLAIFKMQYIFNKISFFLTFQMVSTCSFQIMHQFFHKVKLKFSCQLFDIISPSKSVKIEKQKQYVCLFSIVLLTNRNFPLSLQREILARVGKRKAFFFRSFVPHFCSAHSRSLALRARFILPLSRARYRKERGTARSLFD